MTVSRVIFFLIGFTTYSYSLYHMAHRKGCVDRVHEELIFEYHSYGVKTIPNDLDKILQQSSELDCKDK